MIIFCFIFWRYITVFVGSVCLWDRLYLCTTCNCLYQLGFLIQIPIQTTLFKYFQKHESSNLLHNLFDSIRNMKKSQLPLKSIAHKNQDDPNYPFFEKKAKNQSSSKSKSADYNESLLSTHPIYFEGPQVLVDEQPKKKAGRPKKSSIKKDESDEEYHIEKVQEKMIKEGQQLQIQQEQKHEYRKRKAKKRQVKGTMKNLFLFFHRVVQNYLNKYISGISQKPYMRKFTKDTFIQLLKDQEHRETLEEMFRTRHLNRQIMLTRLSREKKIIYLKRIEKFQEIFFSQPNNNSTQLVKDDDIVDKFLN